MKKCLILPYFGKLPNYFNLWLDSCAGNQDIDWLVITDSHIDHDSENIRIVRSGLDEVTDMINDSLDLEIRDLEPYKLCDYRAAFGLVFSGYLRGYDFWGYCDCDMIYGDIGGFIGEDILLNHDMIQIWGHMTFVRNTEECNNIFRMKVDGIDFFEVSRWPIVGGFDEFGFPALMESKGKKIYANSQIIFGLLPYTDRLITGRDRDYPQLFSWEKGRVYRYYINNGDLKREERMYIHIQKRKMEFDHMSYSGRENLLIVADEIIPFAGKVRTGMLHEYDRKSYFKRKRLFVLKRWKTLTKLVKLIIDGSLGDFLRFRRQSGKAILRIKDQQSFN